MSNSIESVANLIAETLPLSELLSNSGQYRAHVHHTHPPELLEEHFDRVNTYFAKIADEHQLDKIIDHLIIDFVGLFFQSSDVQKTASFVKRLFVRTVVFHDFGKINDNFQADPKKMNNPFFRTIKNNPLKHHHSKLGAYIYVVTHFQEVLTLPFLANTDQRQMLTLVLMMSYPIFRHHAPSFLRPDENGIRFEKEELAMLQLYLSKYDFQVHEDIKGRGVEPQVLKEKFFDWVFSNKKIEFGFSFYALLRLNFSLLTAADYLATGQYSYGLKLESEADWGTLSEEQRTRIITNARTSRSWNAEAYHLFDSRSYLFLNPQVPTGSNLNLLRTEMAVRVLQQLEKHYEKRLFYLEAPTGGGKTNLSMLAVAELLKANPELRKVFYVFPFTTLITQTHRAIKETLGLEDHEIGLLHGRAGFQANTKEGTPKNEESEDGLYGNHRQDFLQNLFALYPISLVTHVRFFDILKSNGKEDGYLMHRLSNSIVILDELQSYPPRHWDKMCWMLNEYGKAFNIRFILMSATLPRFDRIEAVRKASGGMPEFEDLLPNANTYFKNGNFAKRVDFQFDLLKQGEIDLPNLAIEVLEKSKRRSDRADAAGRVFTIVEFIFKKSATEFRKLFDDEGVGFFDKILVLSGTVLESRRREIIAFLKRNQRTAGLKVLLITTQVVEAGVDIDMDLGFKNISLVDSDEQLAGRVNRNVDKKECEVWLFEVNEPNVLYGSDYRYKVLKDRPDLHEEVLQTKDFAKLYDFVFEKIKTKNDSQLIENFHDYLPYFKTLDYPEVDRRFRLIEQKTLSVFVPIQLPIRILNENNEFEDFFNPFELKLLKIEGVFQMGDSEIDGTKVWQLYRNMLSNAKNDFISKKIDQKGMQGILAKFTFSLFDDSQGKNRAKLTHWSDMEKSLDTIFYLSGHQTIYDLESGLKENEMMSLENHL
jgi:CRISPR-associated endonuclease/helicase Cas3